MPADFLKPLVRQFKQDRSPACGLAVNRISGLVSLKFEAGIYDNKFEAERDFRKLAEAACVRLSEDKPLPNCIEVLTT
jgi:hypothetical protein